MKKNLISIFLIFILGTISITSCKDDLLYDPSIIGDGNATIDATVSFHPLMASLDGNSRSAGDAIKDIKDLWVVIYNSNNNFISCQKITKEDNDLDIINAGQEGANETMPAENNYKDKSEESTAKASFKLKDIPFGRYRMYVVANYNGFEGKDEDELKVILETPDKLKEITVKWDQENISANDQMFGCLANDDQKDYDDQAPLIIVNRTDIKLHAWIKRLASKLTLVFDGSGLHQGIFIYINKATIRDIPRYCHFGANNAPYRYKAPIDNPDSLISVGETLYYHSDGSITSDLNTPDASDSEESDNSEDSNDAKDTNNPDNNSPSDNSKVTYEYAKTNWLEIDKSTIAGAATLISNSSEKPKYDTHGEGDQAFYFYENCQGDSKDDPLRNKHQTIDKTSDKPGKFTQEKKDNVPYGTYIEVEGYYTANYQGYLSSGPIVYRFMLGQDTEYNYNALRNRHYKLTLKFKGYANQPDWHIEYEDEEPGLYPPEEYYMSYLYDVRQEMPIRLTGKAKKVTMEIVENNWAPFNLNIIESESGTPLTELVPPESVGEGNLRFQWNKKVYLNENGTGGMYYGLHNFYNQEYKPSAYSDTILNTAPDWVPKNVTPIWVGFLALQAPSGFENTSIALPTGIYNNSQYDLYSWGSTRTEMKYYYYGLENKLLTAPYPNIGDRLHYDAGRDQNTIPLYTSTFIIPKFDGVYDYFNPMVCQSGESKDRGGRNGFTAFPNEDGSVTINVPMFTQPKDLGYITGFSGNNPYEAYYRRAIVKITAEFDDVQKPKIIKYVPIYQMRRIINPKAVWHKFDNTDPFEVKLMVLESPDASNFKNLESNGEWTAWVCSEGDDYRASVTRSIKIEGVGADGKYHGNTGEPIKFKINFTAVGESKSVCHKIIVQYHGNNCEHSIYVRQGYNQPLQIVDDGAFWSSYSVFSFQLKNDDEILKIDPSLLPQRGENNGTWTLPASTIPNLQATLTKSPLALGTLFKRGNYQQGIRIINNKETEDYPTAYGPLDDVTGPLDLTSGEKDIKWDNIYGIPLIIGNWSSGVWGENNGSNPNVNKCNNWEWSPFDNDDDNSDIEYDLPTIEDIRDLMTQGFGVGVLYTDGATTTANDTETAFGFFNVDNGVDNTINGMRGFIVYNLTNYNQVFFPLGYSGIGRRTIANATGNGLGMLRYGSQPKVLSYDNGTWNQYRPISYNNPACPGAVYWAKKGAANTIGGAIDRIGLDMNFFDLTFGPMDYAVSLAEYGDALPIKPVIRSTTPATKQSRKSSKKRR